MSQLPTENLSSEQLGLVDRAGESAKVNLPKVEIFMNQLPIIIFVGEPKEIILTGAVYDRQFNGDIKVEPNGPVSTACPIFANILDNGLIRDISLPVSPNCNVARLTLIVPSGTAPGPYNCALKYTATYKILTVGDFSVGKGNQVNIPYTVKKRHG